MGKQVNQGDGGSRGDESGPGRRAKRRSGIGRRLWLTPAEFERWIKTQGVRISHQKLYQTYLGRSATHPIERDRRGRIHRGKTLEIIKLVQGRADTGDSQKILLERQKADSEYRRTTAERAKLKLEVERGNLVEKQVWRLVLIRAVDAMKQEFRTLAHTLPDQLAGKAKAGQGRMLEEAFESTFRHLADGFEKLGV